MNTTTRIGAVGVILAIAALSVAAQDVKPQLVRESSLTTAETLIARLTASWTYDKLNDAATFVVIATPTKVTTTPERAVLRDIEISTNNIIGIGIETAFDVFTVLKGDRNIKTFVFHHYKLADADAEALRHNNVAFYPKLASFEPKDEKAYLLFLRVEADGRYVAVSGQTDSYMSVQQFTVDSLLHQSHRDPVSSKGALPSSDEYSAKGLQFDCMVTKTNFLVGEPVNIWCAVTNTTDSTKPLKWASESSHFGVAHDETTWFEGILPLVTPQLRDGIKTKSTGWANEQILYIPPHASVTLLLTYNASLNPKQFKGRVCYNPRVNGGGYVGEEGLEEAGKLCGFSNTFEYEVTDKVEK